LNRIRVLLADDHPDFLSAVSRLLETEYEVVQTVADGQAAIDEATKLNPDLLVLDISMPVLNGIEAAKQLKAAGFAGKIVFLTVHADADYVQATRAIGAEGYVVKSRLASDLLPTLREVSAGSSLASGER
jgi:DNA-binding NarL/FixJ family response regulator